MITHAELTRSPRRQAIVRRPVFRCPVCDRELTHRPWCDRCLPSFTNPPISRPLVGVKVA